MSRILMIELLRKVYRKDGSKFAAACYRELLGREPDPGGLAHHAGLLARGASKLAVMTALMQSAEAEQLYRSGPADWSGKRRPSAADLMRQLYAMPADRCVQQLYEELLARKPDRQGGGQLLRQLQHGASRAALAASLLQSGEAVELLTARDGIPIVQKQLFDYANRKFMPDVE